MFEFVASLANAACLLGVLDEELVYRASFGMDEILVAA